MAGFHKQTNLNLTEEDAKHLEAMMADDGFDNRSAWVRRMIRQEWARRVMNSVRTTHETYSIITPIPPDPPYTGGNE